MESSQMWSSLPAVIEEYDPITNKATVRCLVKMRYVDGSQTVFPPIYNVPVITPATAFAGMKLPVKAGDKVVLHIQDRDIQILLHTETTKGLGKELNAKCETARQHNLTDCIAYTGFGSFDSVLPSDYDVWIFNNYAESYPNEDALKLDRPVGAEGDIAFNEETMTVWTWNPDAPAPPDPITGEPQFGAWEDTGQPSSYNHARFKQDGSIELKTDQVLIEATRDGTVNIIAPANVNITAPTTTINGKLVVTETIDATGVITSAADCVSAGISGNSHVHGGVESGPSTTSGPQ